MESVSMSERKKVVVIYSGGMDSFTVLNKASKTCDVYALSFDYGQRHGKKELGCARAVCEELTIPHKVVDITCINQLLQGSSLTDTTMAIPEGHYAEENMKSTVVPNRNMILLSLATGYALSIGAHEVYYGAHAGDHSIYPDCRPEFVEAVNKVTALCDWEKVTIISPYLYKNKIEILKDGLEMELDYGKTWTCYQGKEKACGKCGSCIERLEAFQTCGVVDPLSYELTSAHASNQ